MSGIAEARDLKNFLEWILDDDKRWVFIITDDREAYYRPKVSTPKLDTVFVRNLSNEDVGKIKDKAKAIGITAEDAILPSGLSTNPDLPFEDVNYRDPFPDTTEENL